MAAEKAPASGIKDKVLGILMFVFVAFLLAAFIYLILLPKNTISGTVKIYLFKKDRLTAIVRTIDGAPSLARAAVEELLRGPTQKERAAGYFSEIPPGTAINKVYIEGDTVFVDFNKKLGQYGGGTSSVQGIIAQIVYTLTDIKGIKKVGVLVEGRSEAPLGGEGYVIEKLLSRKDASF